MFVFNFVLCVTPQLNTVFLSFCTCHVVLFSFLGHSLGENTTYFHHQAELKRRRSFKLGNGQMKLKNTTEVQLTSITGRRQSP